MGLADLVNSARQMYEAQILLKERLRQIEELLEKDLARTDDRIAALRARLETVSERVVGLEARFNATLEASLRDACLLLAQDLAHDGGEKAVSPLLALHAEPEKAKQPIKPKKRVHPK